MNSTTLAVAINASTWTAGILREFVSGLQREEAFYERLREVDRAQRLGDADVGALKAEREALMQEADPVRTRLQPMKDDWATVRLGLPVKVVARVESRISKVRILQKELGIN